MKLVVCVCSDIWDLQIAAALIHLEFRTGGVSGEGSDNPRLREWTSELLEKRPNRLELSHHSNSSGAITTGLSPSRRS